MSFMLPKYLPGMSNYDFLRTYGWMFGVVDEIERSIPWMK